MRKIHVDERFDTPDPRLLLRLVTATDCTERYRAWLADPVVNQFLETRHTEQTLESIEAFVRTNLSGETSYLFAICEREGRHVGNIKIGPIHFVHEYADISYFIGERDVWGMGYATAAIAAATSIGFDRLGLRRVQAGAYASNVASTRALEKAGFRLEGRFREQLRGVSGYEDHVWYGSLRRERRPGTSQDAL